MHKLTTESECSFDMKVKSDECKHFTSVLLDWFFASVVWLTASLDWLGSVSSSLLLGTNLVWHDEASKSIDLATNTRTQHNSRWGEQYAHQLYQSRIHSSSLFVFQRKGHLSFCGILNTVRLRRILYQQIGIRQRLSESRQAHSHLEQCILFMWVSPSHWQLTELKHILCCKLDICSRLTKHLAMLAGPPRGTCQEACREALFEVYTGVYQHVMMTVYVTSRTRNTRRVPRCSLIALFGRVRV